MIEGGGERSEYQREVKRAYANDSVVSSDLRFALSERAGYIRLDEVDGMIRGGRWLAATHCAIKSAIDPRGINSALMEMYDVLAEGVAGKQSIVDLVIDTATQERFTKTLDKWEETLGATAADSMHISVGEMRNQMAMGSIRWHTFCMERAEQMYVEGQTPILADDMALMGVPGFLMSAAKTGGDLMMIYPNLVEDSSYAALGHRISKVGTNGMNVQTLFKRNLTEPTDPSKLCIVRARQGEPGSVLDYNADLVYPPIGISLAGDEGVLELTQIPQKRTLFGTQLTGVKLP